jgi:hypothetical protein
MAWNNAVGRLANTSPLKVHAATLIYAISLAIRSSSAAGKKQRCRLPLLNE